MERKTDGHAERASTSWAGQAGQQGVWSVSIIPINLLLALVLLQVLLPNAVAAVNPARTSKQRFTSPSRPSPTHLHA
jgi:hypothetical protein